MVTIKDVAQSAGVSVTTVSHVINKTRFVRAETCSRVLQAVSELSYVPSALARSLKSSRTHTIGTMIPNCSNPYFAEIVRGIEDVCFHAGFTVILCNSDDDASKQERYVRVLLEKQIDGLIVLSSGSDEAFGAPLAQAGTPLVLVDREVPGLTGDLVEVDHEAGAYLATQHLIELGHITIGCIAGPLHLSPARQRLQGFRRAFQECGHSAATPLVREADFTSEGGYTQMQALLALPKRPSAVFACNDLSAIGATRAVVEAGLRVPQDISIVGFDDIALAAYASPPLTTVAQPKHEVGALAAQLLLERISAPEKPVERKILQPVLALRQSTQTFAGRA